MKLKLLSIALCAAVTLAACKSTPEEDMSLPVGFEQQAQLLPLKRPVLTLTDEAWHQAIGPFQLTNMDLSGKSTEKVSTSTGWQTTARGGLLFQLMFHDEVNLSGDVVNKFNTRAEQTFSFDLQAQGAAAVHAECQILVFGQGEETLDNGVNSYNWQTSEQQLSYLGCKLTQDGQVSTLVVEDKAGTAPVYKLNQGSIALTVSPVQEVPELAKYNSFFQGGEYGYLVGDGQNTKAALQLSLDQSRLWVSKDLPAATQQWYVAALFSLQMYDWQNRQWPVSSPTH
jgi:hypothetical protein